MPKEVWSKHSVELISSRCGLWGLFLHLRRRLLCFVNGSFSFFTVNWAGNNLAHCGFIGISQERAGCPWCCSEHMPTCIFMQTKHIHNQRVLQRVTKGFNTTPFFTDYTCQHGGVCVFVVLCGSTTGNVRLSRNSGEEKTKPSAEIFRGFLRNQLTSI